MARKEYLYEIEVSRGWAGVEQLRIAAGTDDKKLLRTMVNEMAEAMQDRADWHQKQRQVAEEITQKMLDKQAAQNEAAEQAENNVKEEE